MSQTKSRSKSNRANPNPNLPRMLQVEYMSKEYMNMYNAFCRDVVDEWQPIGPMEKAIVRNLADLKWRAERANSRKRLVYSKTLTGAPLDIEQVKLIAEIQRHFSGYQHDYQNTMKQLQQMQARRK